MSSPENIKKSPVDLTAIDPVKHGSISGESKVNKGAEAVAKKQGPIDQVDRSKRLDPKLVAENGDASSAAKSRFGRDVGSKSAVDPQVVYQAVISFLESGRELTGDAKNKIETAIVNFGYLIPKHME